RRFTRSIQSSSNGNSMLDIEIIGGPLDLGAGRRGVNMGPSALRLAGLVGALSAIGHQVHDSGDILVESPERQVVEQPRLRYLREIVRTVSILSEEVLRVRAGDRFPLVLGGD